MLTSLPIFATYLSRPFKNSGVGMKTKEEIIVLLRQKEAELAEELRKMEEFHKAAWEQYGSELCAGEMLDNERKVVKNI